MTRFVDLHGASVVVTGAGSGIGRAAAMSFARRGGRIVVTDVLAHRATAVATEIRDAGSDAIGLACDVSEQTDLERVRDSCLDRFGRVDVVMNNVGVLMLGAPESIPVEAWQKAFDINVLGIVRSNLVFLPLLVEQASGHIVNTASFSGLLAHGYDRLPYVTSKHAVVGMTEALALYLRPLGIGVTCLCPGGVRTNIAEQMTFYGEPSLPRAPDYEVVDADFVGELVADAVAEGRFLVVTAPAILDELIDRATDIDSYIERLTTQQQPGSATRD